MFRCVLFDIFKNLIIAICVGLSSILIQDVIQKNISGESYQAVQSQFNEKLMPPVLTICPGPGFKSSGPFMNKEHLLNVSYSAEELFHPNTLTKLRNTSLYNFKEQYSSYYGLCYVMQKLTAEGISEFSFEIVVNDGIDYNGMLHEPDENEWLFMNVYPYEIEMTNINANNSDNLGAAGTFVFYSVFLKDIILGALPEFSLQKGITRKLERNGCTTKPLEEILQCWIQELTNALKRAAIKCKVPALEFTRLDTSQLDYCTNKEDALTVENFIYEAAQTNLQKGVCDGARPCEISEYVYLTVKHFSRFALSKGIDFQCYVKFSSHISILNQSWKNMVELDTIFYGFIIQVHMWRLKKKS